MSGRSYRRSVPLGVQLLAFLTAIDGLVAVIEGVGLIGAALPVALLFLAVGGLHLYVAHGLWNLDSDAYVLGFVVFGVGFVVDLLTGNVVAAALSGVDIYLLYRHRGLFS